MSRKHRVRWRQCEGRSTSMSYYPIHVYRLVIEQRKFGVFSKIEPEVQLKIVRVLSGSPRHPVWTKVDCCALASNVAALRDSVARVASSDNTVQNVTDGLCCLVKQRIVWVG